MSWITIPWCDIYEVSSLGMIRNKTTGKFICHNPDGRYKRVWLCNKGFSKRVSVHRLVASLFIQNPLNLPQVNHINGIRTDNRVENLEWCTSEHNNKHAVTLGLRKKGGIPKKLDKLQVLTIKNCLNQKVIKAKHLAKYFKVDPTTISHIKTGSIWPSI